MGLQQSKEELVYQQVNYGNVEGIKSLRREGAGLEWIDKEGKTPLILACMRPDLLNVVKVLIELGANVNAYRPGTHAGTPLHHAAKRGLDQTVILLLSHGANPLMMNDDCQTPLDLARAKGHCNVVRAIESRICLFSGWLREHYGPSILEALAPQWLSRKIWAVILPCDSRKATTPCKFELAIYPDLQVAKPRVVIQLWKVHIEEPKFNQPDPVLVIVDKASSKNDYLSRVLHGRMRPSHRRKLHMCHRSKHVSHDIWSNFESRYKFLSAHEGDKQQLQWFYNTCRGIIQQNSYIPVAPVGVASTPNLPNLNLNPTPTSAPMHSPLPEDVQMAMAINASIQSALAQGIPVPIAPSTNSNSHGWGVSTESTAYNGWGQSSEACPVSKVESTSDPYNGWAGVRPSASSPQLHTSQLETPAVLPPSAHEAPPTLSVTPSAPPIEQTFYNGPIHYPTVDFSAVNLPVQDTGKKTKNVDSKEESSTSSSCVICLDAPVEGACIPCGHMAGCMSCLTEIKGKKWGCPVCRANIDQVIRLYTV